jgi:hypothetical protein
MNFYHLTDIRGEPNRNHSRNHKVEGLFLVLSFLPIPNSPTGMRFLIRSEPPDASVTQFPKTQKFVPHLHENPYLSSSYSKA